MKKTIIVGTNLLVQMAQKMFVRGEITEAQMLEIHRRNDNVPECWKENTILLGE